MSNKAKLSMYASHHSLYVQDSLAWNNPEEVSFDERTTADRLAVGQNVLVIGTGSHGNVKVVVEADDVEPPLDLSEWDHVTEAGIDVPSGVVLVMGCLSYQGLFFWVRKGHRRVRCCHANLQGSVECGKGRDWYLIQIWPAEPAPARVLKRWSPQQSN
ncbi:MAG: hypothetical protein JNM56_20065 [Planctomycetia bacterium]|nr:hypothetical protein [Planctomycetia bacterium]